MTTPQYNGIDLEAVDFQFEPLPVAPLCVTWDSSQTVVIIKLRRTSALSCQPRLATVSAIEARQGRAAVTGPCHPINHVPGAAETPAYANPGFATNLKIELSCTTVPGLNSQASGSQLPPRAARRGREVGHSHSLGMFC